MSAINHRWQRDVQIYNYPLFSAPFIFWSVLAVIGVTLSLGRLFTGLWFTGMNDDYAWGVWKTFNVMTLTALGSGGLAFSFTIKSEFYKCLIELFLSPGIPFARQCAIGCCTISCFSCC